VDRHAAGGSARRQALQNMLGNLFYQDPETAAQLLQSVAPGQVQSYTYGQVAASGRSLIPTRRSPGRKPCHPVARKPTLAKSRSRSRQNNPVGASKLIDSSPPANRATRRSKALASIWASSDVTGAVEWVKNLPEGAAKDSALQSVTHQWTQSNPQDAAPTG